jgi:hypothetical protein
MVMSQRPCPEEVEQLLLNAQLRDELEPYLDESLSCVNVREVPTPVENEFLASILAWERAPVLPISQWFEPELIVENPDVLDDGEIHRGLWDAIHKLYSKRIVLDFADHLTDRELYGIIFRDILPSREKKIDLAKNYLHWNCAEADDDGPDTWLQFYASEVERAVWADETGLPLPPALDPPHPRKMPSRPL